MSFIIKGIDLPIKKLQSMEIIFRYKEGDLLYGMHELLKPNQAIQIPKGARLIDANALFKDLREQHIPFNNDINSAINVAPTILESEEEE